MKKRILIVLLSLVCVLCVAFGLSACSGSNDDTSTDTGSNTNSSGSSESSNSNSSSDSNENEHNLQAVESVAATCTTDGNIAYWYCEECGKYYSDSEATEEITLASTVIEATDHDYNEKNICTVCGTQKVTEGLSYTYSVFYGGYEVSIGTATDADICIADTYEGDPVTAISSNGFYRNIKIKSVYIPDSVTYIGENAFKRCYALTSITIGSGVTSIGSYAFEDCYDLVEVYNLSSLTITAGSTDNGYIGCYAKNIYTSESGSSNLTTQDNYIFYNDNGTYYLMGYTGSDTVHTLPTLTVDGGTVSYAIFQFAFFGCSLLTSVTIPNRVTSIGSNAFNSCDSLTSVTIPESVTSISDDAFLNCKALTEIHFNSTAMSDLSEGNFVFAKAGQGSDGITVTIGANVTKIPAYLFYPYSSSDYTPNVTSIVFEDNSKCTSIGDYAFAYCTSLENFTNIPASATFNETIIEGCTKLDKTIFYTEYEKGYYFGAQLTSVTDKTISYLIIKDGTTSIAANALADCTNLRFVYIPESVTEIGDGALDFTTSYDSWTTIIYFESSKGATSISTSYTNWLGKYTTDTTATYQGVSFTSKAYGFQFLCVASSKIDGDYIYRSEDGLSHASTSSNASAVTYAYFGTETDVIVPSTLGGYTVTRVGGYTFAETDVTSVTLPSSVTYIGAILYLGSWGGNLGTNTTYNYALNWMPFTACDKLTTVNINASVPYILGYSFYDSTALTTINFASDCWGVGIYNNAFDSCTSLTSISLPEYVMVWSGAFIGSSITSVTAGGGNTATICTVTMDESTLTFIYDVLATVNQGTELATALKGTYLKQDTYLNYNSSNS